MKKIVLTFGLISGAVMAVLMFSTLPFMDKLGHGSTAYVVGYTTMVLSFVMVFVGIRSYRENVGNGAISFGRAFAVGILITLIACVCYVIAWEIIYFNFMPDFVDKYSAHVIDQLRASGASAAAIEAKTAEMQQFKKLYANPFYNALFTFLEPFPVGLLITLVSAGILRKKRHD